MKDFKIIIMNLILFMFILLLIGCGRNTNGTFGESNFDSNNDGIELDIIREVEMKDLLGHSENVQDLIKSINEADDFEIPVSSSQKIQKAMELGQISEKEAMAMELIQGVYPEKLPPEFKGDDSKGSSRMQEAHFWLRENWDSLDSNTKEDLEPFYVSLRDPKSFVNQEKKDWVDSITIIPSVQAVPNVDEVKIAGRTVAGIVYESQNTGQLIDVEKAIKKAWPMYKSLFGVEPTETIRFVIQDPLTPYGEASMVEIENGNEACDVLIKAGMGEKLTMSTTAHELFHCFQFHIPLKYKGVENKWLMEATAVWAEDYVYPDYNQEFRHLPGLFYSLSSDTIRYGLDMEYQTYVMFLYLTQKTGSDQIVKDILFDAKTKGGRKALTDISGFNNYFAEYALYNWNQDEWHLYHDNPSFPEGEYLGSLMKPMGKSVSTNFYQEDEKYFEKEKLVSLSAKYAVQVFADDIDKVTYNFDTIGDDAHRIQALVSIGGKWHYEDWTGKNEKTFCKSAVTEDVETVVLILSNADGFNSYDYSYDIDTSDECPKKWRGTMTIEWNAEKDESFSGVAGKGSTTKFHYSGKYVSNEVLEKDGGDYDIVSQTVTYNAKRFTDTKGIGGTWGWEYQYDGTEWSGGYNVDYSAEKYKPRRWQVTLDDDDHETREIYFDGVPVPPGFEWCESVSTTKSKWVPMDSSIPPTIQNDVIRNKISNLPSIGESFYLEKEPSAKVLKGRYVDETGSDGVGDFDFIISYDYVYG